MKRIYVSHLTEHVAEEIEEEFYLKEIRQDYTKESGIPYLSVILQDKSGSIRGRIWENNIEDNHPGLKGTIVKVNGEVLPGKEGALEFTVWKMQPAGACDISSFTNGLGEDESMRYRNTLLKQMRLVKHAGYQELLDLCLTRQWDRLAQAPACLKGSGDYNGGLLVQTVCVTSLAVQLMRSQQLYAYRPDHSKPYYADLLVTAALLFDIGTVKLFSPFPEAEKISAYALLPRDILSIQLLETYVPQMAEFISTEDKNLLYHVIQAAHKKGHGRPMNREACLLSAAYQTYLQITEIERGLKASQKKKGAVYIPDYKGYLYINGGNTDESITEYP